MTRRFIFWTLLSLMSVSVLSACAPLIIGGAATGALAATDRRSSGSQLEDEVIEFKLSHRLNQVLGERSHINVTSYNRSVLLTGEVLSEADKAKASEIVSQVENVNKTLNELIIAPPSSLVQRATDSFITAKVKTRLLDVPGVNGASVKVVTERSVVYLMGLLTPREIEAVSNSVRTVSGIYKVVRAFEAITEDELKRLQPKPVEKAPANAF